MTKFLACLSIHQPWASLCVAGIKPWENRTWYCAYRGDLAIHAGKTWGREEGENYKMLLQVAISLGDEHRVEILFQSRSLLGGIVGVVDMTGCVHSSVYFKKDRPPFDGAYNWFVGPYGYRFENARMLPEMVPYRGFQGLFKIPSEMIYS